MSESIGVISLLHLLTRCKSVSSWLPQAARINLQLGAPLGDKLHAQNKSHPLVCVVVSTAVFDLSDGLVDQPQSRRPVAALVVRSRL